MRFQTFSPTLEYRRRARWMRASTSYPAWKRAVDITGAVLLTVLLMPLMLILSMAIWLESGWPIFFRSSRLGPGGRPIDVLKFRTMRNGADRELELLLISNADLASQFHHARKLTSDPRRTLVGAILRRASLDELPQLWNVLRGEMALVGPRPYFASELDGRIEAAKLLSMRPGITGLWQVSGRSELSFAERVELELLYIDRACLALDAQIAMRTVLAVVTGRGAY